jgi:hypothetical protein
MHESLSSPSVREIPTSIPAFRIEQGLRPEIIGQLVRRSREPEILKYGPSDAAEMFKNEEAVREWLGGNPDTYVLTPRKNLAGMAWFAQKEYPLHPPGTDPEILPRHTFEIRMYEGYAGRGLAKPFMHDTLVDYMQTLFLSGQVNQVRGLWISVDADNPKALKLASDFGYIRTGTVNKDGVNEHIMVLSNPKITDKITGA